MKRSTAVALTTKALRTIAAPNWERDDDKKAKWLKQPLPEWSEFHFGTDGKFIDTIWFKLPEGTVPEKVIDQFVKEYLPVKYKFEAKSWKLLGGYHAPQKRMTKRRLIRQITVEVSDGSEKHNLEIEVSLHVPKN